MVKKQETHDVWYTCEKCHSNFSALEEAEACENQEPTRLLLRSDSFREETDWEIGDFLLIQKGSSLPELVRVLETIEMRHKTWPRFQHLNFGDKADWKGHKGVVTLKELYNYDAWNTKWVRVVNDSIRAVILDWADAIRGGE